MELNFLGRGAAFNTAEGNTAACLREGRRMLLLDCGETVFSRLLALHLLDGVEELLVAVSHLHSDHCGSLGSLALYCYYSLGFPLKLVLPGTPYEAYSEQVCALMKTLVGHEEYYERVSPDALCGIAGIRRFSYVETLHDADMHCFSFVMETDDGAVFYSADTCRANELQAFLASHTQIEAIYTECCAHDFPGNVHLPLDTLTAVIPPNLRKKTFLMHLSDEQCLQKGLEMGFSAVKVAAKGEHY